MTDAGQKIIAGLKDAVASNFSRVTIDGQTWVKQPHATLLCELEAVRQKMSAEFHGIGEPAIGIPPDKLLVTAKDGSDPKMRMCDFIELVRQTLDRLKPETPVPQSLTAGKSR